MATFNSLKTAIVGMDTTKRAQLKARLNTSYLRITYQSGSRIITVTV
jgi:hypothetical protein